MLLARVRVGVGAQAVRDHFLRSMILAQMEPQMMLLVMKMEAAPWTSSFSTPNRGVTHPRRPLGCTRAGTQLRVLGVTLSRQKWCSPRTLTHLLRE